MVDAAACARAVDLPRRQTHLDRIALSLQDAMDNPLLDFSGLPRFDAIRPEHIAPAIESLLAEAEAAVARAETIAPVTWSGAGRYPSTGRFRHGPRWRRCWPSPELPGATPCSALILATH